MKDTTQSFNDKNSETVSRANHVVMLLCFPVALLAAEANADFENENNYDAYCAGNGKIHVKVLIFSERGYDHNAGRGNNQSLGNEPDATLQLVTGGQQALQGY